MKRVSLSFGFAILLVLASAGSVKAQPFKEEDLAATIAHDSGHPAEGYREYAKSLARTLSMLNPTQIGKIFKGRGPLRKADLESAEMLPQADQDSPTTVTKKHR